MTLTAQASCHVCAEANAILHRLLQWLPTVPVSLYQGQMSEAWPHGQTPGRHVRHIIDHYLALTRYFDENLSALDYENRQRDSEIETNPAKALDVLQLIKRQLGQFLTADNPALNVHHTTDTGRLLLASSVKRELSFITQHTVHHLALIEFLLLQAGAHVPIDFAVHPSTLRYMQRCETASPTPRAAACAP